MYYKILGEFQANGNEMVIIKCESHGVCVMGLEELKKIIRDQSKYDLKAAQRLCMEDMIKCTLSVDLNTCPFHKVALMDGEEKIICENPDFKSCGYHERPPEKHVYERKERWYEKYWR